MKLELTCPQARYDAQMRIHCKAADDDLCAHQRFKACKGWWALTDQAEKCPMREKETANAKRKTAKKRTT